MSDASHRIAAQFSRAASRYDAAAGIQREVALRLAGRILTKPLTPEPRVMEIGAGTGILSRILLEKIPGGRWLLTDLSKEMLERCQSAIADARVRFAWADGQRPPAGPFDLIASSLALQWVDDLAVSLERLTAQLAPGGFLAFATLGSQTFQEWRRAHAALGLSCGARELPSAAHLAKLALMGSADRGECRLDEEMLTVRYADGHMFVRTLEAVGASTPRPGHRPLSPAAFKAVVEHLGADCAMTYHVLYGILGAA